MAILEDDSLNALRICSDCGKDVDFEGPFMVLGENSYCAKCSEKPENQPTPMKKNE